LAFLGGWIVSDGFTRDSLRRIGNDLLYLGIGCAIVGWVAQAVLVMFGVRLTGRPAPAEAADYDDAPPDRSPAGRESPTADPPGPDEFP
jgi:hypothetical protein